MNRNDWRAPLFVLAFWAASILSIFFVRDAASIALWTDELYSLNTAREPLGRMIKALWDYVPWRFDHPPLYFIILHFVLRLGDSPFALRFLSLFFIGLASVLWSLAMWKKFLNLPEAAALAALLLFHPTLAYQATNVRMYALFLLLATGVMLLLGRLPEARGRRATILTAILSLILTLILYTSYFGLLFVFGVGFLGLILIFLTKRTGAGDRAMGIRLLTACLICGVLFLPWVPALFHMNVKEHGTPPVLDPTRFEQIIGILKSPGFGITGNCVVLGGLAAFYLFGKERTRLTLFFAAFALIPFFILAIAAPESRRVDERYIIYAIPLLVSGAAVGWKELFQRLVPQKRIAAALTTIVLLLPVPWHYAYARGHFLAHFPDWWAAADILESSATSDEIIMTGSSLSAEAIVYHLDHGGEPRRAKDFTLLPHVLQIDPFYDYSRNSKIIWYVTSGFPPKPFQDILNRYFPYRAQFPGNRAIYKEDGTIQVYAKKPFKLPWGGNALYTEPIPLYYEQAKGKQP